MPTRPFVPASELPHHRARGHRCHAVDGSRLYVASNCDAYPCLMHMDDRSRRVAEFENGAMRTLDAGEAADDRLHDFCHFIKIQSDGLKPLCIFYKDRLND